MIELLQALLGLYLLYIFLVLPYFIIAWNIYFKKIKYLCYTRKYFEDTSLFAYRSNSLLIRKMYTNKGYLKFNDPEINNLFEKLHQINARALKAFFISIPIFAIGLLIYAFS